MLRTLLAAVATLGAIGGGCFALQAGALGRPDRGTLEAVQTLHRLVDYQRSHATFVLGGKAHTAVCRDRKQSTERVAAVAVVDGLNVLSGAEGRVRPGTLTASAEFMLAGCPRAWRDWLASALARNAAIQAIPTTIDGQAVDQIRVLRSKTPLELFVAHASGLPVQVGLFARRIQGVSSVHFQSNR